MHLWSSQYAVDPPAAFFRMIRLDTEIQKSEATQSLREKMDQAKKRCQDLELIIRKLYESYATEIITESRFQTLLVDFEKESADFRPMIRISGGQISEFEFDTNRLQEFLKLAGSYSDFSRLTPRLIYEFIDRIVVHALEKKEGHRTQEVEIFLKHIGRFRVPGQRLIRRRRRRSHIPWPDHG